MKTFLKTIIGGALGIGALYVVGKVCYEAGKNVAEVEHQLENLKIDHFNDLDNLVVEQNGDNTLLRHIDKIEAKSNEDAPEQKDSNGVLTKIKNARLFLGIKKTFDKRDRKPGILGSLLTNPDGAKIEAIVKDGGVQISVKPRAE